MLASLTEEKGQQVLSLLPEHSHEDLLYRLANLKELQPQTLQELERVLELFVDGLDSSQAYPLNGLDKAAALLGRMDSERSHSVLEQLRVANGELAEQLADAMLTFELLLNQSDVTLRRLLDEVPQDLMVKALKGADDEQLKRLYRSLPNRAAQYLAEALEIQGATRRSVVESAQREVLSTLRQLADSGEIELDLYQEVML